MALAIVYPIEGDVASNVFVFIDFPFEALLTVMATLVFLEFFFVPFPIDIVLCDWSVCHFILFLVASYLVCDVLFQF